MSTKNINKSLVGVKQDYTLDKTIQSRLISVDLAYDGYQSDYSVLNPLADESTFEKWNLEASRNRFLVWAISSIGEYVREPTKGGIFDKLIGKIMSEDNIKTYETEIQDKFNKDFENDLYMTSIHITKNISKKELIVEVIIQDLITRERIKERAEVSL